MVLFPSVARDHSRWRTKRRWICCGQLARNFFKILFSVFKRERIFARLRVKVPALAWNKLKSNFSKISGESYPVRGWPQKQAFVYTSDIKREWFGVTDEAANHSGRPIRNLARG